MNSKYEFIEERFFPGPDVVLHRIKAIRSFGDIKKGAVGGWVEGESNLPDYNNSWVSGEGMVFGQARLEDDCFVMQHAKVFQKAQINKTVVMGNAEIFGESKVDNAFVGGDVKLFDQSCVLGTRVFLFGKLHVYHKVIIRGPLIISPQKDTPVELNGVKTITRRNAVYIK